MSKAIKLPSKKQSFMQLSKIWNQTVVGYYQQLRYAYSEAPLDNGEKGIAVDFQLMAIAVGYAVQYFFDRGFETHEIKDFVLKARAQIKRNEQ